MDALLSGASTAKPGQAAAAAVLQHESPALPLAAAAGQCQAGHARRGRRYRIDTGHTRIILTEYGTVGSYRSRVLESTGHNC